MQQTPFPSSEPGANAVAATPSALAAATLAVAIAAAAFLAVCGSPVSSATPPAVVALSIAQERT